MHGAAARAAAKRAESRRSDSPTTDETIWCIMGGCKCFRCGTARTACGLHIGSTCGECTSTKLARAVAATRWANDVLPAPGRPCNRMPRGGGTPSLANVSKWRRGVITAESNASPDGSSSSLCMGCAAPRSPKSARLPARVARHAAPARTFSPGLRLLRAHSLRRVVGRRFQTQCGEHLAAKLVQCAQPLSFIRVDTHLPVCQAGRHRYPRPLDPMARRRGDRRSLA
eukprot:scaffold136001_cov31-Tisochrysis_lutea.AAC.3